MAFLTNGKKEDLSRVPPEVRDHFIDDWSEWVSPSELADKLDVHCTIRNTTPSVKKMAHLREYPSKSYIPKRSSLDGRFNRFNQESSTSSFNRNDKLKTDDKSERPLEVQTRPNLEENTCLLHEDEIKCLILEKRNELGELLNLYGAVFEPGGDPTPFIEYCIKPGENHLVPVPPKLSMYRNTGALSTPLPFSQSTSAKSNYARDGPSSSSSLFGSSSPSSSSRMNRPVPPASPLPLRIPYQNQDPAYATLSPKSPLLSSKNRGSSPATSQTINHDIL
ncbi:hypothetical protein TNCV_1683621 [Trichonephila clavipes]|nr:hypothetical protein TNCV_1683621 [Trichonephila clavipes]